MPLPNTRSASIDLRKLEDYCLNPEHPVGCHKAIVFKRILGWTIRDAKALRNALLRVVQDWEAVPGSADYYGSRYTVDFPVATTVGSATVRSAWIIRADEDFPRLATCFVLPDR